MSTFGHAALGAAFARLATDSGYRYPRWWLVTAMMTLAFLPDLDFVVPLFAAVDPHGPWGHRGASHSLLVSAAAGAIAWFVVRRQFRAWVLAAICAGCVASHGIVDMLTDVDLGVMLLWPVTDARLVAPWHPIPIAPVGPAILSPWGAMRLVIEIAWFAPVWLYAVWPRAHERPAPAEREPS